MLEIGNPEPLKSFSLDDDEVQQKMVERYGDDIPWDELMVAPSALFDSDLLELVEEG